MLTLTSQQWGKVHGHVFLKVNLSREKNKYNDIPPRKLSFIEMTHYDLGTEYTLQLHTANDYCK